MSERVMPAQKALDTLLFVHPPMNGFQQFSGFNHALQEARCITNRNADTGIKDPAHAGKHGSWLGAIGYFALLDLIGKSLKPRAVPRAAGSAINQALCHFTSTSEAEADALYALRCAFAHDYSLYNFNNKKASLTHNFIVHQGPSSQVVRLPQVPWDGDLQNHREQSKTYVNLEAFGDLVEKIVSTIQQLHPTDGLEILLPGGSDELVRRYIFGTNAI